MMHEKPIKFIRDLNDLWPAQWRYIVKSKELQSNDNDATDWLMSSRWLFEELLVLLWSS